MTNDHALHSYGGAAAWRLLLLGGLSWLPEVPTNRLNERIFVYSLKALRSPPFLQPFGPNIEPIFSNVRMLSNNTVELWEGVRCCGFELVVLLADEIIEWYLV